MKDITVTKIIPTNPVLLSYVDKIRSWDKEGKMKLVQDEHVVPFYALFYDATFFGAGTIEFDKENSVAKVAMINAKMDTYNQIKKEAENKFQELLTSEFNTKKVEFCYIKKRG